MKHCSRCNLTKEYSAFHRCSSLKDGHHYYCKVCVSEYKSKRRYEMEILGREIPDKVKCTRCFTTKSRFDFGKNTQKTNGLCSECKACRAEMRISWGQKNKFKVGYGQAKAAAKSRNLPFQLTYEQYIGVASQPCHYCHVLSETNKAGSWLDRKDSSLGYTVDNLLPCCASCNILKGASFSVGETEAMVTALIAYREAQGLESKPQRPWLLQRNINEKT